MRIVILLLTLVLLSADSLLAAPPPPITPKVIEFQAVPIAEALRQVARDAKVQLVLDEAVTGTVSIRFESTNPMEALRVLAESKGLFLTESVVGSSIYFVSTPQTRAKQLGALDTAAFPAAIARYKRRLFDALCHEGFTEQQALTIVAADRTPIADVPILKP